MSFETENINLLSSNIDSSQYLNNKSANLKNNQQQSLNTNNNLLNKCRSSNLQFHNTTIQGYFNEKNDLENQFKPSTSTQFLKNSKKTKYGKIY